MKKTVCVLAACAVIVTAILGACSKKESAETGNSGGGNVKREVVKFWYSNGGDSEVWEKWRIGEFEGDFPQYVVESTYVPDGAGISNGKLMAAINSGDVPDVICTSAIAQSYSMAAQGAFEPIDKELSAVGFDFSKVNPAVLDLIKYNGASYLYPQNTDANLLFWRTDIFEEAGLDPAKPPRTIAELDAMAEKLVKREGGQVVRYGFIPWIDAGAASSLWPRQFGADPYDESTNTVTLSNPAMAGIYEWQRSYAKKYDPERLRSFISNMGAAFSPDHPFMQGKVVMTVVGNWFCNALRIYAPDLPYEVAPIPALTEDLYGGCTLSGNVYAFPKGAENLLGGVYFAHYNQEAKILDDNNKLWRSLGIFPDSFEGLSLYQEKDPKLLTCIEISFNKNSGQWVLSPITSQLDDKLTSFRDEAIYTDNNILNGLKEIETALQAEVARLSR
ncbi:MAG: extracellular solute-binding protein [Treponema sp.]|jgi:multiple sugar transport system substrate-binding protein|nr:extracellular solute-binding protein [Treponema sp.]